MIYNTPTIPYQIEPTAGHVEVKQAHATSLRQQLESIFTTNTAGNVQTGLVVLDATTGKTVFAANGDVEQYAASLNKLPVTLLVLEDLRAHKIKFNQVLTWDATDQRAGAGIYDQAGAPTQATVKDVLYDLLNKSGNTAVRVLVNKALGGAAAVNARWAEVPELSHTYLQPLDANRFYMGYTSTNNALWAFEKVIATQDRYGKFVTKAMATNIWTGFGVRSQLPDDKSVVLVNKIGLLDDPDGNNRHDVGVVYNKRTHKSYAYAMLTTSAYTDTTATALADQSLKTMGDDLLAAIGVKPAAQPTPQPNAALAPQSIAPQSLDHADTGRILY